jgi:hypothetical protein
LDNQKHSLPPKDRLLEKIDNLQTTSFCKINIKSIINIGYYLIEEVFTDSDISRVDVASNITKVIHKEFNNLVEQRDQCMTS